MQLAYLTTEYPFVSHTFIRREILGLEEAGHRVLRLSIRDTHGRLVDPSDLEEHAKTFACLARSPLLLLWDAIVVALASPAAWFRAIGKTWSMYARSDRSLLRHVAYLVEAACLQRVVRRAGVEHLHAHFGTNCTAVARIMRALGGPSYSFTVHGPTEFDAPSAFSLGPKIADAAFVVAITDYCAGQLWRWAAWEDWHKVKVVHCTVAESFFDAAEPIAPDARTLVCVGRLTGAKGQLLLLEAVNEVIDSGIDLRLVLAGDGEMRGVIEQRVEELGLGDRVQITGFISEQEVRQHVLSSRGLVLPSFAEGLPVVIMEALALRRPVISTRITGIPELVRDGENGWLITSGNHDELVRAIREIMVSPADRLNEMGRAGQQAVRERHTVATEVAKLAAHFAAVHTGSRGDRATRSRRSTAAA